MRRQTAMRVFVAVSVAVLLLNFVAAFIDNVEHAQYSGRVDVTSLVNVIVCYGVPAVVLLWVAFGSQLPWWRWFLCLPGVAIAGFYIVGTAVLLGDSVTSAVSSGEVMVYGLATALFCVPMLWLYDTRKRPTAQTTDATTSKE